MSFHFGSALYVSFDELDECSGSDGLMEEDMTYLLGYSNDTDLLRLIAKKHKQKGILVRLKVRMIVKN